MLLHAVLLSSVLSAYGTHLPEYGNVTIRIPKFKADDKTKCPNYWNDYKSIFFSEEDLVLEACQRLGSGKEGYAYKLEIPNVIRKGKKDGKVISPGTYIIKNITDSFGSRPGENLDFEAKMLRKIRNVKGKQPANVINMYGSWPVVESVDKYKTVSDRSHMQLMEYLGQSLEKHAAAGGFMAPTGHGGFKYAGENPMCRHVYYHKKKKKLSLFWIVKVHLDLANGLKEVHAAEMTHQDNKPDNICVIENDGIPTAKVIDFGISIEKPEDDRYLEEVRKVVLSPLLDLIEGTLQSQSLLGSCSEGISEHKTRKDCGVCVVDDYVIGEKVEAKERVRDLSLREQIKPDPMRNWCSGKITARDNRRSPPVYTVSWDDGRKGKNRGAGEIRRAGSGNVKVNTCKWREYTRSKDKGKSMLKTFMANYPAAVTKDTEDIWRQIITEGDSYDSYFQQLPSIKEPKSYHLEGAKYARDRLQKLYDTLKFEKGDTVRIASGRVNRAGRRADHEGTIIMIKGTVYFVECSQTVLGRVIPDTKVIKCSARNLILVKKADGNRTQKPQEMLSG